MKLYDEDGIDGPFEKAMRAAIRDDARACPGCGKPGPHGKYTGPEGKRMEQTGECFICAFWELKAAVPQGLVIDGYLYSVGAEPGPRADRSFLGMGGRRFDVELFDGRQFTTHNLWAGGQIPERFRERIPDTARFLDRASRHQVGSTTCWSPASESNPPLPPYPGAKP